MCIVNICQHIVNICEKLKLERKENIGHDRVRILGLKGYIYPWSPSTPVWEPQGVSGPNSELAYLPRYQMTCWGCFLKWEIKHNWKPWERKTYVQIRFLLNVLCVTLPRHCVWTHIQSHAPIWSNYVAWTSWTLVLCSHSVYYLLPDIGLSADCLV